MRVLITRPMEDAKSLAAELRARGHEPILSPLMEIRFVDGPQISLANFQAVLATSANGVRALARRTLDRNVPVFAVGPQTTAAAQDAGFSEIRNAAGDARSLANAVVHWADPAKGPLLHAAGRERAGRLAGALSGAGFSVQTAMLYEAVETAAFSPRARDALQNEVIDAVMLFSPRSARLFTEQTQKIGLEENCRGITALCISEAAAEPLKALALKGARIARHPDQYGMLALLDETAAAP
jgi:uroporphyrinogen-III synthase